ncbi:MAG: peptidoglycan DD-metalloendopeptidase family protein [Pseudomonadota bacterium]
MPRRFSPLFPLLCLPLLAGCVGNVSDLDFDFRNNAISRAASPSEPRPEPDANGLITYESYQVAVARRGDTVADVALRLGLDPNELARFNGRWPSDALRPDEVIALPRRVGPGGSGSNIADIARGAIDEAEAASGTATAAVEIQRGTEPVRHRVTRGETVYSIARLYGVSVRALAEWNGLGPDLNVREGQFLIIPLVIEDASTPVAAAGATAATPPGRSVAPLPPSAAAPLPAPIEQATLPDVSAPAPDPTETPAAAPAPSEPAAEPARFVQPVDGPIIRGFTEANEGIDIQAAEGTPVRAAGAGQVAAITENTDQITILVLRHDDGLLTVYANIRNVDVSRGDTVTQGQTIAEVGPGDPPFLHFEVRRGMAPENPNDYLP